ncbi:MAG TPA: hypothetical protein VM754_03850, partial [Actinomycetota bacterium]|nr:hypothetical protein [Actinomycetota bacterium]
MITSRRLHTGGRHKPLALLALLVTSIVVLTAGPAAAISMTVSPRSGPPGTRVNVSATATSAPCEVFFDSIRIIDAGACRPGETASTVFTIPANTSHGPHAFRAVEGGDSIVT